jgi:hypothetical protein
MPGTLIGAFVVDWLGPKYTMIAGLLFQSLFGFIMSGLYTHLKKHVGAFAVIYGIFLSFGEFGVCCPFSDIVLLVYFTT